MAKSLKPSAKGRKRTKAGQPGVDDGPRYPRLRDLISLLRMMQGSTIGVTLADIQERFGVSRRTAERLRDAVTGSFDQVEEFRLDDGLKRWRLRDRRLDFPATIEPDDLAALTTIGKLLQREGHHDLNRALQNATDTVKASMRSKDLRRAEPDVDALAEAEGVASRPGPRERLTPAVILALRDAIKRCAVVKLTHWTENAKRPSRGHEVEPLGLLYGNQRRYLVGRSRHHGEIHLFRISRILDVQISAKSFIRPRDFVIGEYATKSFGVFQEKPFEAVWRFSPDAATDARGFIFHPTQQFEPQADGSLVVRFRAGSMYEMCWHLFTWGDAVEVLKPRKLRSMYRNLLAAALKVAERSKQD